MEKMSRVKKYQEYRDSITNGEDVSVKEEETVEDDSFNDSINQSFEFDDLSFTNDDLSEEKEEEALTRVRESAGDSVSFNTRVDILNQIKSLNMQHTGGSKEEKTVTEPEIKKEEDFRQSISDIIKNDNLKVKDEPKEEVPVKNVEKPEKVQIVNEEIDEEYYDEEEEEGSTLGEKILTFLIVLLCIVLVSLIAYTVKYYFFS